MKYYQESIYSENSQLIDSIETEIDTQLKFMENQHKEYVNHCNAQIVNVQNQIAQIKQKQQQHCNLELIIDVMYDSNLIL